MTTMDTGNVVVAEEKEEEEEDPYPYDIYISARINDKLEYRWYVIKNDTKENEFLSPVFSDLQPNCKFASSSACVVALGSFLYVLGGFDLTDKNHDEDGNLIIFNPLKDPPHTDDDLYTNEVYRIDTLHLEDGWTKCPPMAKKRSCALGFSLDGKIYVLGGFTLPVIHKRPDCWPDWFLRGDDDDSSKSIDVPSSQSQSTSEHNNYIEFLDPEEGEAKWRPALSSIPDDYLREHHIDAFLIREKPSGGGARELFVRIVGNETQKLFRYDFNDESWTLYANDFGPYRCQSLVFADDILYSYDNYPAWEGKLTKASKVAPGSILCFDVNKPEAEPNELKGLEDLLPKPKYFNMFPMVTLHHLGGTKFCLIWEENYTILEPNEGDEIVVTCLKFTVSKVPLEKQGEFDFCATQLSKSSSCLEAKDFVNIISIENAPQIRWRKGELIGCGAFGRVYMGMNLDSGELLAVRQVLIATNSASKEKAQAHIKELEEEVKYLKNLSHPNIVRYLGTVREEEYLNILLEFVPGGSISSLLGKFGSFPEAVIRTYTKQLLLGLEYLHKNGIMHRDIKGANILVDNKGCIKLADFGAFKKVVELATVSGAKSMKGTPYWMAPEVILQTGHSFSADIWSVGCTVIEMATGKPPWSEQYQEVAALFHIGTTKSHPPIPEHLSVEAKDFLLRCLQKEPEVRQPANELLKHPFVSGEVNISSVLIPDDFNKVFTYQKKKKSFNPMCEPADDWRHNYDGSAEPGTRGTSMDTDQPVKRSVQFWRGPVKRSASSPEISGVGGKDFSFHCGRSLSEEDDELTESRITAFLDEQILYLKKLQTRLYEEYEVYDSSLNAASSPNFAETRSEIRKCKEELEHLEISKWKEKLEHSKVPKWKE